jgi:hypothetical protein
MHQVPKERSMDRQVHRAKAVVVAVLPAYTTKHLMAHMCQLLQWAAAEAVAAEVIEPAAMEMQMVKIKGSLPLVVV